MYAQDLSGPHKRPEQDTLLAKFAFFWMIPALVLSVVELIASGKLTPAAVAFDAIAAIMLPFGLLSLAITLATRAARAEEPPADEGDEDGGGGGGWSPPHDEEPPPLGGLTIDWDRFESDFRDYVDSTLTPVAGSS